MLSLSEVAKLYPGILACFPRLQSFEKVLRSPEITIKSMKNVPGVFPYPMIPLGARGNGTRKEERGTRNGAEGTGNGERGTGNRESVKRGISKPDG